MAKAVKVVRNEIPTRESAHTFAEHRASLAPHQRREEALFAIALYLQGDRRALPVADLVERYFDDLEDASRRSIRSLTWHFAFWWLEQLPTGSLTRTCRTSLREVQRVINHGWGVAVHKETLVSAALSFGVALDHGGNYLGISRRVIKEIARDHERRSAPFLPWLSDHG